MFANIPIYSDFEELGLVGFFTLAIIPSSEFNTAARTFVPPISILTTDFCSKAIPILE